MCFCSGTLAGLGPSWYINKPQYVTASPFNKWLTESFNSNDLLKMADSIETKQVRPSLCHNVHTTPLNSIEND